MSTYTNIQLLGAYIEITSDCNLRCLHCYNDSGKRIEELKKEEIDLILKQLCGKEDFDKSIAISGGEPLLHKEIFDLLGLINQYHIQPVIITNGTLMTKEKAEKFSHYQVRFQLSVNGSKAEIHDALCGVGTYKKTMEGIKNLLLYHKQDSINIHVILNQYNIQDVFPIIRKMTDMGLKSINFSTLASTGRMTENKEQIYLSFEEVYKKAEKWRQDPFIKQLEEEQIEITFPEITTGCPLLFSEEGEPIKINPRIDAKGNVYLCQSLDDKRYILGNIHKNRFLDILNGEKTKKIIDFLTLSRDFMDSCNECVWKNICAKGCPASSLTEKGNILFPDEYCSVRKVDFLEMFKSAGNE